MDYDRTLAEVDQALPVPNLQLFVDTFPSAASHVSELALGDMKLD
jgi:hypothetical protein